MTAASREADWTTLMRAALAGDASAYQELLRGIAPHIRTVARSRCRRFGVSESEAEDIVQEVLFSIHLKRNTWDPTKSIGPWVNAIVRNKVIDILRRRGRRTEVPIEDVTNALASEEQPDLLPHGIDMMLQKLTMRQREIVRSISINGAGTRETAKQLDMTEVAVRVSLHRALKALAALYRSSVNDN